MSSLTLDIYGLQSPSASRPELRQFGAIKPSPEAEHSTAEQVVVGCPQSRDCPVDGVAPRILECQQGCGFRGCAACMEIHESEPHADDASNTLEMARNIGSFW